VLTVKSLDGRTAPAGTISLLVWLLPPLLHFHPRFFARRASANIFPTALRAAFVVRFHRADTARLAATLRSRGVNALLRAVPPR
jgi:hypothetical protein